METPMECTPAEFESNVRRVARYLWPSATGGARLIDNQERDGFFETEECIYIVEATCSRKKDKAEKDASKIQKLIQARKSNDKPVIGYIVTFNDPTADQHEVIIKIQKKSGIKINIVSFEQFQAKVIDAENYLHLRGKYYFGSIHDPVSGKYTESVKYIDGTASDSNFFVWTADKICKEVIAGSKIIITGDYGAGKSMTLREVFKTLVHAYKTKKSNKFPIYINLREHQKQQDVDEILERHARRLGFENKSSLVRAWNLGFCHLILDGFDEMMSSGISAKRKKIRDIRYNIVTPIREFIKMASDDVGIIIAGRQSYFDTNEEKIKSLGANNFVELTIGDFKQSHIDLFLKENGISAKLPEWIPTRPLLLGTLILKGYLNDSIGEEALDPAAGWDMLLDEIAKREANIETTGVDPEAVRAFLETLASIARNTDDGLGALTYEDIVSAFIMALEYEPDEDTLVLLLRLPGLGYDPNDKNIRKFIDIDFANTCAAGFLFDALELYSENKFKIIEDTQCSLSELGLAFLEYKCKNYTNKQKGAIIQSCLNINNAYIKNDAIMLSQIFNTAISERVFIQGISGKIALDCSHDLRNVTYSDCVLKSVEFDGLASAETAPTFKSCYIEHVDGIFESNRDLFFDQECEISSYRQELKTTDSIMSTEMDTQVKVLVSILKKLYIQKGAGRLETAFYRGLDTNAKKYVEDILRLLCSEKIAIKFLRSGRDLWLPDKKYFPRVGKIISSPMTSGDSLITKVLAL